MTVFLTIGLIGLSVAFEKTRFLSAFDALTRRIAPSGDGIERALGIAMARLQTGLPPSDSYQCRLRLRSSDGADVENYHIVHTRVATDRWTIEAIPSDFAIEDCPTTFEAACPVVP